MRVIENHGETALASANFNGERYLLINPYKGCEYGCGHCSSKIPMRMAYPDFDWGGCVEVRNLLPAQLAKKRFSPGKKLYLSSLSDPYQPLEKKYKITRESLKAISEKDVRLRIITHSDLILRDLDIIKGMKDVEVGVSLFSMNDAHVSLIENGLPSSDDRIELIYNLKDNGIRTFLNVDPFLPEITPLKSLINVFIDEVDFIRVSSPKWNSNTVKKHLFDIIKIMEPEMFIRYKTRYLNNGDYFNEMKREYKKDCKYNKIEFNIGQ